MGKFSKLLNAIGIPVEDEFEEAEEMAYESEPAPAAIKKGKVVNLTDSTQFNVVVIQPENFDEAKEIADHLKTRKPVVINLELLDKDTAQKIFDFLNGAIYALGGSVQKVATNIYLIAPQNVGILGDFRDELKNKGLLWS
ncbi:MAG: cell division protein SepF [Clostridia bacterium]|nr:cell division protein SepF [Clostridia bacterium]